MTPFLKAYPAGATRVPRERIPPEMLDRMAALGIVKKGARKVDFIKALDWVAKKQAAAAKAAAEKGTPVHSTTALQEMRESIADFLIAEFGVAAFLPTRKMGGKLVLTTACQNVGAVQRWVSVVDGDARDLANWPQTSTRTKEGTYIMASVKDMYATAGSRIGSARVWLPTLGVPVTFTSEAPKKQNSEIKLRGGFREMRSFPLAEFWKGLGVGK